MDKIAKFQNGTMLTGSLLVDCMLTFDPLHPTLAKSSTPLRTNGLRNSSTSFYNNLLYIFSTVLFYVDTYLILLSWTVVSVYFTHHCLCNSQPDLLERFQEN